MSAYEVPEDVQDYARSFVLRVRDTFLHAPERKTLF